MIIHIVLYLPDVFNFFTLIPAKFPSQTSISKLSHSSCSVTALAWGFIRAMGGSIATGTIDDLHNQWSFVTHRLRTVAALPLGPFKLHIRNQNHCRKLPCCRKNANELKINWTWKIRKSFILVQGTHLSPSGAICLKFKLSASASWSCWPTFCNLNLITSWSCCTGMVMISGCQKITYQIYDRYTWHNFMLILERSLIMHTTWWYELGWPDAVLPLQIDVSEKAREKDLH